MNAVSFEDLRDKVVVITGGGGVIGRSLCEAFAASGARLAITDMLEENAREAAAGFSKLYGIKAAGVMANVLDRDSLERSLGVIHTELGPVDILINCAGGNSPKATTQVEFLEPGNVATLEQSFYGLDVEGFRKVFDLNFLGTILPTMVYTKEMATRQKGVVLNISSMNSFRPLTKIPAYSAAKASINNFTEWLAVHLAKVNIRVNAVAPGFFLTNQNRFLLTDEKTGELTPRGKRILGATPMGTFGTPEDLQAPVLFLCSDASRFITGIVLAVDGGFNAYSGV
jgi:NAD(P)-dependent dehydrogenase (short-subunit alcohol dehydrogenase family)